MLKNVERPLLQVITSFASSLNAPYNPSIHVGVAVLFKRRKLILACKVCAEFKSISGTNYHWWIYGSVWMCVLACGSNRGYTECYCQHWAEGLHSSEWTLGRARRLSVALCAPPLQVQQQTLCSTLWFHLFVLTRLITYKIAPVKRGIGWKQTKAASWGISSPAAVTWWCWQMFISITSFWTLMCKKINPLTDETIKMPAVIAECFSSNLYCIYSHTFLLSIGWTEAMPRERASNCCHIMSSDFLTVHVRLLCLGGPAFVLSYFGVQTWETLENLIKKQR